jgi:hypothetical protein
MERGAVLSVMKIVILRFLVLIALLIGLQLLRRHFEPFVLQANDNVFGQFSYCASSLATSCAKMP